MLSSKTLTGRITTSNTRLFAIRLEVSKATSMDIKHMILIANSLDFARKAIDFLVYSGQAHSLAVCSALRLFFCSGLSHEIEFWDCSSKAE